MYYVILKKNDFESEIERFTEEKWNRVKNNINPARIEYVTTDLNDEEIKKHKFTKIIWDRYYDNFHKCYAKINVNIDYDNFPKMEDEAQKKIEELKEKIKENFIKKNERWLEKRNQYRNSEKYITDTENIKNKIIEQNKFFTPDMDEFEILSKWKSMDYPLPAANVVTDIKDKHKMSWSKFKAFVEQFY